MSASDLRGAADSGVEFLYDQGRDGVCTATDGIHCVRCKSLIQWGSLVVDVFKGLVGPAGEAAAERFVASIYPATVGDAQSGMARLSLLVEPRLGDSEAWWVFNDPARLAGMAYGGLASVPGPQVQRQAS